MDINLIITTALPSLISAIILLLINRSMAKRAEKLSEKNEEYQQMKSDINALKIAMRIHMKDRVRYLAQKHIASCEISFNDRANIIEMHDCYHNALGGNGELDDLMSLLKKLQTKIEHDGGNSFSAAFYNDNRSFFVS